MQTEYAPDRHPSSFPAAGTFERTDALVAISGRLGGALGGLTVTGRAVDVNRYKGSCAE
jgi:hypothetical protein